MNIKDLDGLLRPVLNDKTVASYKVRNLTANGENYGSLMLAVDAKIKNPSGEEDDLYLVAKCIPNEMFQVLFSTQLTYKKEAGFYSTVIPTLQQFQRSQGSSKQIDTFPKYYGSRLNLNNSDYVDADACLLLENLKIKNYDIGSRSKGFDFITTEYLIKNLAAFHAVPLAVKIVNPELFKSNIKPFISGIKFGGEMSDEMNKAILDLIIETVKKNPECEKYMDRILITLERNFATHINLERKAREPFATIVHTDYWVNNTMLKYENGIPVGNALVDFQFIQYGSPAQDLIFFLFSSVDKATLKTKYDYFIKYYHECFIDVLKDLKVDVAPFNFNAFLEEIDYSAKEFEFLHILMMLKPIYSNENKMENIKDMDNLDLMGDVDSLMDEFYTVMYSTILEFVDRKWI